MGHNNINQRSPASRGRRTCGFDSQVDNAKDYRRNALSHSSNGGTSNIDAKRRLSHSPVSVNTAYELCQRNTDKLWREFNSHLRESTSGGREGSRDKMQNATYSSYQQLNQHGFRQKKNSPTPLMRFRNVRNSLNGRSSNSPQKQIANANHVNSQPLDLNREFE